MDIPNFMNQLRDSDEDESLEQVHERLLAYIEEVGEEQFFKDVWNNPPFSIALSYVHPEDKMRGWEKFRMMQDAFINAIV